MEECKAEIKRIMAALDLSAYSESTFTHALTLARALNAELIILNVINDRGFEHLSRMSAGGFDVSVGRFIEEIEKQRTDEFVNDYLGRVGKVPVRLVFKVGIPYEQILKAIKDEQADMVVMGTKGRTALAEALFGTSAEKVFRRATCPVVSVRGPEHCRIPTV